MSERIIPYGHQSIDQCDVEAVREVLRSEWITQGPLVSKFEQAVATLCGNPYPGVAVSSATAGLHLACLAAGIGPGDRVWTSPNTFVASANCAIYCGASVDFVDIDPTTLNLCPLRLEEKLVAAKKDGTLPKAVIPVHFAGHPADMEGISRLAAKYGFVVIEDASHAIGAGSSVPVGSCLLSDLAVFSFHPVKIITTAEGGMIMARKPEVLERLRRLRSHGITRDFGLMSGPAEGPWYYQQLELGFNYRLSDLQCALGLSQLARIEEFLKRRRALARRYQEKLQGLPLRLPPPSDGSAWHLYVIQLSGELAPRRKVIFEDLRAQGIGVNVHYIPVHLQPFYRSRGFRDGDFPVSESYYRGAITLPIYYEMSDGDQDRVVSALTRAIV